MSDLTPEAIKEKCLASSQFIKNFIEMEPLRFRAFCENIPAETKNYYDYHRELTKKAWELDEEKFSKLLRCYRVEQHAYLIIKDLLGYSEVTDTLAALSDLASAVLDVTYNFLYSQLVAKHGIPRDKNNKKQQLVIFGMGKLGGRELNFSSDIDLILAYPDSGETDGERCIDNDLFFHRLAQKLIRLLDRYDQYGFAYRVDMRLKPFGSVGNLCTSFPSIERYYLQHGRNWERYALVKMRPVAGDIVAGREMLSKLESFVYHRHVDYDAVNSIEEMRQKIVANAHEKSLVNNLKLGYGGIREIEFIVQTFQMMYGGRITALRQQSLLRALRELVKKELINEKLADMLKISYLRLRKIENAIQYYQDQQTHDLPATAGPRAALLAALDLPDWLTLAHEIKRIRFQVAEVFKRIFASEDQESKSIDYEKCKEDYWLDLLFQSDITKSSAENIATQFASFYKRISQHESADKYLIRLNWVLPQVIIALDGEENPVKVTQRILVLLESIADKSVYLSLLVEHPSVLKKIIRLFLASSWMTKFLCDHPLVIDELIHENYESVMPMPEQIAEELESTLAQTTDNESRIQKIIDYKNAQIFRVASADLQNKIKLMNVSDQITWVAESVINEILIIAQDEMKKYGKPCYTIDGKTGVAQFGIIAYGKLGGLEMGYKSDLDLVFLHNSQGENQQTDGEKTLDNSIYFSRLVAKLTKYLTYITINGRLYDIDTRLRPSGKSGLPVSSLAAFMKYHMSEAWTWERQALVRARFVAGGDDLKLAFNALRQQIIQMPRDEYVLREDVLAMRQKMLGSFKKLKPGLFHVKHEPGGVTDIEFIVQYLILKHAKHYKHLIRCSDNMRQISALELFEIIRSSDASELRLAYRSYRLYIHRQQLLEKRAIADESQFVDARKSVKRIWEKVFNDQR